LNVHEGPIGIGTRVQYSEVALAEGNVISNEPGYYEDGKYGIRIENVILVSKADTKYAFGDKPWFKFEHVTMVPYCRKLIDPALLTPTEKKWLNDYNAEIREKTKDLIEGQLAKDWLEKETRELY
jgi:Xaa-Pro aminopeptidase